MIKLCELLHINQEDLANYKIHFAIGAKDKKEAYKIFLLDEFKGWQEEQTNKNFGRRYVLSLVYYEKDIWMFGGIYQVEQNPVPIQKENLQGWRYKSELVDKEVDLIGRAFFRFKKEFRASYPGLELVPKAGEAVAEMPLSHILDKKVSITDFPGFEHVNIDYKTLKKIVSDNVQSWKSTLSSVKGIYLIVDTKTGKQYVGSAYGDECIWQRWSAYVKDGHGGNIRLKDLLKVNGEDYRNNFKYSILEVCNMNLGNEYIIDRESYWKEVLLTREYGLNEN